MSETAATPNSLPVGESILANHDARFKAMEDRFKALREQDATAKAAGELLGRYIQESYADGYAFYEIIKVNKKSVRIQVVTGIGDDWVLPYWGVATSIPIAYAEQNIKRRDGLAALFARK